MTNEKKKEVVEQYDKLANQPSKYTSNTFLQSYLSSNKRHFIYRRKFIALFSASFSIYDENKNSKKKNLWYRPLQSGITRWV